MLYSMIVAHDLNFVIGKGDTLPWRSKIDMKWFIQKTKNKAIVMGATTALGIGKSLPNRENYVLTSNPAKINIPNIHAFSSIEDIAVDATRKGYNEIVICGGQSLYKQFIDRAQKIYITEIPVSSNGDVYLDVPLIKSLSSMQDFGYVHHGWTLEAMIDDETEGCTFMTFVKIQNPITR